MREINRDDYLPYLKKEGMYRFYNLLGLFCMRNLGFDASIFYDKESALEEYIYGLWAKVLKPSHFVQ